MLKPIKTLKPQMKITLTYRCSCCGEIETKKFNHPKDLSKALLKYFKPINPNEPFVVNLLLARDILKKSRYIIGSF